MTTAQKAALGKGALTIAALRKACIVIVQGQVFFDAVFTQQPGRNADGDQHVFICFQ